MNSEYKQKVTEKFINLLAFEPWSNETLEKACEEAGFDKAFTFALYPGKIAEFTHEFVQQCNENAFAQAKAVANFQGLKIGQKVEEIIYARILQYHTRLKNFESLKKFIGYSANPKNIGASLGNIYEFANDVWYEIGDKSTDISYYTRRLSLSAIYSKCMLYSLSDKSDNLTQTKKFIQKSIDALLKINKLKQKVNEIINNMPFKFKA